MPNLRSAAMFISIEGRKHWCNGLMPFLDPLLVSKSVERQRVEQFASVVGGVVSEGAA
jgi:hypothetical protein